METDDNVSFDAIVFGEIDREALATYNVGALFKLWSKPDIDFINGYVKGSIGGEGKIFSMKKDENPLISSKLDAGLDVWLELTEKIGNTITVIAKTGNKGSFAEESVKRRDKYHHSEKT